MTPPMAAATTTMTATTTTTATTNRMQRYGIRYTFFLRGVVELLGPAITKTTMTREWNNGG